VMWLNDHSPAHVHEHQAALLERWGAIHG
jgi:hypothetical protein